MSDAHFSTPSGVVSAGRPQIRITTHGRQDLGIASDNLTKSLESLGTHENRLRVETLDHRVQNGVEISPQTLSHPNLFCKLVYPLDLFLRGVPREDQYC